MLMGAGNLHLPDRIISSEYLTLEKSQFSKSRNHAIWLPDFLKNFDADILRYFLIANGPETSDADFSWQELKGRINNELIANLANCVNRTVHLIKNNFPDGISSKENENLNNIFKSVGDLIEKGKFREALKNVFILSEKANKHLAKTEPWKEIKNNRDKTKNDLYKSSIYCVTIAKLLHPFLPETSEKIFRLFGLEPIIDWKPIRDINIKVTNTTALFKKIEDEQIVHEIKSLISKLNF
jgi:methionyl-tRNA synthetase